MDNFVIITIVFVILLILFTCRWCCRTITKSNIQTGEFVTVTTVPGTEISIPYPLNPNAMPQPGAGGAIAGLGTIPVGMAPTNYGAPYPPQSMPYPPGPNTAPYPPGPNSYPPANTPYPPAPNNLPYPPPSNSTPYPMAPGVPYPPNPSSQQNPPSYAEATGAYERQSAFNPDFK